MEVQFNNEGLNMFVFLIVSCPNFPWLIPKQVSIIIVAFINIHIATYDDAIRDNDWFCKKQLYTLKVIFFLFIKKIRPCDDITILWVCNPSVHLL